MSIIKKIEEISSDIKKYSPYPEKVKIISVTKYVDSEIIEDVIKNGGTILGENKVQVLVKKYEKLSNLKIPHKWHFIGNLQKNKVKYIANFIDLIHSVNKLSLAKELDKRAKENNRIIDVLIEINAYEENSKNGYEYKDFLKDIPDILLLKNIRVKGLMAMAPFSDDFELIRKGYKELKSIKEELNNLYFNGSLTELSMGMSNDYKIALEEGATLIRIGSKIFS